MPAVRAWHRLHPIHVKNVGRTPWAWRDGVVVAVNGEDVVVQYIEPDHRLRVWHHHHRRDLRVATRLRVDERDYVLSGPFGWLNTGAVFWPAHRPPGRLSQPGLVPHATVIDDVARL